MDFIIMKSLNLKQRIENQSWIDHFEEKYGFIFFPPSYNEVPFVSKQHDSSIVKERIESVEDYLIGTYPIFMKTNSSEEIGDIMHKEESMGWEEGIWFRQHSKLRINIWGANFLRVSNLNRFLGTNFNLGFVGSKKTNDFYFSLSFDDKKAFVSSFDKKLYSILSQLYENYSE